MEIRERRLSPRARRALPLIVAAVLAGAGASVAYLHPTLRQPAKAAGPSVLPDDYQATYSFITPSLGWALVAETTSATPRFSVFRTTDAAGHWKGQLTRRLNTISLAPAQIRFFDADHGLIALGDPAELYRTSDGGTHWALVKTPAYFYSSLVSGDALHAWFLGWSGPPAQSVTNLFSTSDGGDRWTPLPQSSAWARATGGYGHANFAFRNATEGWFGALAAEPTVYFSADAGTSWEPRVLPSLCIQSSPLGPQRLVTTAVGLLPGRGVVAFANGGCGNSEGYTSFDGGISWRSVSSPPGSTTYSDFVYQDSSHWWAMRFGALWKSSDAGHSWKLVSQQKDGGEYVPHVVDANHAWAEVFGPAPGHSGAGLAVTSDGGAHWTPVSTPRPA